VFEFVAFQVRLHSEAIAALRTLKGLDVEVHQVVLLEGILPHEVLFTHGTRERPLVCVCDSVGLQVQLLPEALAALEGFDVEVHKVVFPEGSRTLELLVTHGARERLLVSVCESVLFQGRLL